ncbi:MAG TPA: hypothetical protein HPQ04_12505, partial [Rhodospirillaceae bacterium]|nr:hypothetical protein [Rhodospirillaceae bacterium]
YNAWALLSGRLDRDLLVSQIPSFYNPLLDVPFFLAAQVLPARLIAFLLGAIAGLNLNLLTLLGERLLTIEPRGRRLAVAWLLAVVGGSGAVALSELGTVFYDNILSLGFFASLLLLLRGREDLAGDATGRALMRAAVAGLPVGLAFGLKQSTVMFPIACDLALLLTLSAGWRRNVVAAFGFGLGVLAATAAGGGAWMWHLWASYGNPVFPQFNQIFQSPWALVADYRDTQYLTLSPWQKLVFPALFSADSRLAGEIEFRDFRILAAFLLLPAAALAKACRKVPAEGLTDRQAGALVMTAAAAAYLVWLKMFGIYRYLTPLEMLAPLLVFLAVDRLPAGRRTRLGLALAVVAGLLATTRPGVWIRVPFSQRAVEVSLPAIADPAHTAVILAGHEPLSFLLPAFPPEMRFWRIDSTFTNPDQPEVRFNRLMAERIREHQGPLLALFIPTERQDVTARLGQLGLTIEDSLCRPVTSPIGAADYALCPLAGRSHPGR